MADTYLITAPILENPWARLVAIAIAYAIGIALSGHVVRKFVKVPEANGKSGSVIGKCENIIAITFILLQQETGLALIFAAKSLVRGHNAGESDEQASYYLGGTLVNLVWSVAVAVVARAFVIGL